MFLVLSFLLGSIPFGVLVARLFHVHDLRQKGSGNTGATNVSRVAGFWPAGFIVFVLDLAKGAVPAFLGTFAPFWALLDSVPHFLRPLHEGHFAAWAGGLLAVAGHCYSPWLKFRGGKGVATGFGALLVLQPIPALAGFIVAALIFHRRRIVSISCLSGIGVAAVVCGLMGAVEPAQILGLLMIAVIVYRHEENIDALLEGRERQFR